MRELWRFTSRDKLDKFLPILTERGIAYEETVAGKNAFVVMVEDSEYPKAKKLLLKHRERRTSGDLQ